MKRKMGIRGLLTRSTKNTSVQSDTGLSTTDVSETRESMDVEFPSSNQFISRPPPLEPHVEHELRDACQVILRDLKPSGHDIEDRRMKTDILLDEDPYRLNHHPKPPTQQDAARSKRQHSAAAWIMNGGTEQEFKAISNAKNARAVEDPSRRAAVPKRRDPPQPQDPLLREYDVVSATDANQMLATEAPLAPLPTNTSGSRQPSMATSSQMVSSPRPAQRADSASTDMSTPFTPSTDHNRSASTAPSSAAMTSAGSSHRSSDNVYIEPATAQDEEWMKQEVEKHKLAQNTASNAAGAAGAASLLASQGPTKTVPLKDRRGSQNARTLNLSSQSGINAAKRPTINSRSSSRQSGGAFSPGQAQPTSPTVTSPALARQGSTGSNGSKRNKLSIDGIHETRFSPQASPRYEDVPPVPRLDAERLNSLTSASRNNSISLIPTADAQRQNIEGNKTSERLPRSPLSLQPQSVAQDLNAQTTSGASRPNVSDRRDRDGEHAPPLPPVSPNRPTAINTNSASSQKSNNVSQGPASPHQHDGSVLVRDFYRPTHFGPNVRRGGIYDPTPADFDALMSAMDGAVRAPVEQSTSHVTTTDPSSSTRPNLAPPKEMSRSSSNYSARSSKEEEPKEVPSTRREAQTQTPSEIVSHTSQPTSVSKQPTQSLPATSTSLLNDISSSKQSPPVSHPSSNQQSRPTSVVTPSRTSDVYSSQNPNTSSKKPRAGLSKLMWRLGGGDMPQRRKIYIPPPEPQQAVEGEEYQWEEEEACAAPVVGFGRGW